MRLALATLWILAGGALTAGIYWGFLNTPESTVWTLIVSAILAVAALVMAGITAGGAIVIWSHGASLSGIRRAMQSSGGIVPAALVVMLIWWLANHAEIWLAMRSGQISAWFIARFGIADITRVFTMTHYLANWFRWVIAPLLALSLMAGIVAVGWPALARASWLRRALHPRALLLATVWFVLLIALPWIYLVPWRPKSVIGSSTELGFIVAKLSITAILFAIGAALIACEAARVKDRPTDPSTTVAAA